MTDFRINRISPVVIINDNSIDYTNPSPENLGVGTVSYPGVPISTLTTVTLINPGSGDNYYTIDDSNLLNGIYKIIINKTGERAIITGSSGGVIYDYSGGVAKILYDQNSWYIL